MQKILEEMWYGNICPFEQIPEQNKYIKELDFLAFRNKENLISSLTNEQKLIFEKYEQCQIEKFDILQREIFIYGFRYGGKIMLETL